MSDGGSYPIHPCVLACETASYKRGAIQLHKKVRIHRERLEASHLFRVEVIFALLRGVSGERERVWTGVLCIRACAVERTDTVALTSPRMRNGCQSQLGSDMDPEGSAS